MGSRRGAWTIRPTAGMTRVAAVNSRLLRLLFPPLLLSLLANPSLPAFETAGMFRASDILPPPLLAGSHHRVRDYAEADGYLIHFTVDSDFGVYPCAGASELRRRIAEIDAIGELVTVSKGDLFAEGLRESVETPIEAVKNIAENPRGAIRQVPHSVGHFFSKVGSGIGNAARKAGNKKSGEAPPDPEQFRRGGGQTIRSAAGFDKAKLECARQLGVDPYTDNARLQEEMEKVAWAFFAGGLPLRVGVSLAAGGASRAISATEFVGLPDDLYQTTPAELDYQDRNALKDIGIPAARIDALFENAVLPRSVRHPMVGFLAECDAPGRGEFVEQIIACDSVWRAHFLNEALKILRWRHRQDAYSGWSVHDRLVVGITRDGAVEIPAPVDYLLWTAEVAEFAYRERLREPETPSHPPGQPESEDRATACRGRLGGGPGASMGLTDLRAASTGRRASIPLPGSQRSFR